MLPRLVGSDGLRASHARAEIESDSATKKSGVGCSRIQVLEMEARLT